MSIPCNQPCTAHSTLRKSQYVNSSVNLRTKLFCVFVLGMLKCAGFEKNVFFDWKQIEPKPNPFRILTRKKKFSFFSLQASTFFASKRTIFRFRFASFRLEAKMNGTPYHLCIPDVISGSFCRQSSLFAVQIELSMLRMTILEKQWSDFLQYLLQHGFVMV
jgi:hypothetical protein